MSLDIWLEVDRNTPGITSDQFELVATEAARITIPIREDGQIKELSPAEYAERHPDADLSIPLRNSERDSYEGYDHDDTVTVYSANVTHNLGRMAAAAGLYIWLWRIERTPQVKKSGILLAQDLIKPLELGLRLLKEYPEHYKEFNPQNGWGTYETLVSFVEELLEACKRWPMATVDTWR